MTVATLPDPGPAYAEAWEPALADLGLSIFRSRTKMSLLEWAEAHRRWPDESPYRADQTPHVRDVFAAYSDPGIEEITIVKPTQSGLTEGLALNAVGYHIDEDPRHILIVIPSVDEAGKWSKKKLQPMIDASPRLHGKLEDGSRKASNTTLEKSYPGGSIGIIGSNSGRGFRMVTIGVVIGDDVEGWDSTAGKGANSEGDQVTLLRRRTDRVADRKLVWISTPRLKGGRIHKLYTEMEARGEFHVPCPHCGEMQVLRWGGPDMPYGVRWDQAPEPEGYDPAPGEVVRKGVVHRPDTAFYLCEANGCVIAEMEKPGMEEAGEYLDDIGRRVVRPGVRSVGLWLRGALTITLPGSEWPRLIREFLKALDDPEKLRAFWNLVLGEFWETRGVSLEWERLYERREDYPMGVCPVGVEFLTVGVDIQDTWVEAYVWGWGWGKESWLIDHVVIDSPITRQETKDALTELLQASYETADPHQDALPIAGMAVDTGHEQEAVVAWAREVGDPRVMLVKGSSHHGWSVVVGTPTKSEVTFRGKRTGLLLWPVGTSLLKQETYGFLGLPVPIDGEACPPGSIHLPMVDDEVCKQLVGEDLVIKPNGSRVWEKNRHRQEGLDCRIYARASAERLGLGRMVGERPDVVSRPAAPRPEGEPTKRDGWIGKRRGGRGRGGRWLK